MPKARLACMATLALVLAGLVFWAGRATPRMELHFLRATETGDAVNLVFRVQNLPPRYAGSSPLKLERLEGPSWQPCPNALSGTSQEEGFQEGNTTLTCQVNHLPPGRFRLVVQAFKERFGLSSFFTRVKDRLTQPKCWVSLNPFNTDMMFLSDLGTVTSNEFKLP
jgi:hypothetical protein